MMSYDQGHYTIRAIEIGNSLDYVGGMFVESKLRIACFGREP
jgi:hypothetical protein